MDIGELIDDQLSDGEDNDEPDGCGLASDGEQSWPVAKGKAKSTSKGKAKTKGKATLFSDPWSRNAPNARKGGYGKTKGVIQQGKDGRRSCRTCLKEKPDTDFALNNNDAACCRQPLSNLRALAKAQNILEWFVEYTKDRENRLRLVNNYNIRCPENSGNYRGAFPLLQYQREIYQESQMIKDSVFEMMTEAQYQHWVAKPKNGGLSAKQASLKFLDFSKVDGPSPISSGTKWATRCGVQSR